MHYIEPECQNYTSGKARGLCMKNLASMNKALLSKWSRHYANERGVWWVDVIKGKYGEEDGGWFSCITRVVEGYEQMGLLGLQSIYFVVGDGRRTKFWKDRWCRDMSMDVAFPSLFSIATAKEDWPGDLWSLGIRVATRTLPSPIPLMTMR